VGVGHGVSAVAGGWVAAGGWVGATVPGGEVGKGGPEVGVAERFGRGWGAEVAVPVGAISQKAKGVRVRVAVGEEVSEGVAVRVADGSEVGEGVGVPVGAGVALAAACCAWA